MTCGGGYRADQARRWRERQWLDTTHTSFRVMTKTLYLDQSGVKSTDR